MSVQVFDIASAGEAASEASVGEPTVPRVEVAPWSESLYYYHARYYDPELGRFLQADTVLDGINRYAYCHNNPVRYVDPTGHGPVDFDPEWEEHYTGPSSDPNKPPPASVDTGGDSDSGQTTSGPPLLPPADPPDGPPAPGEQLPPTQSPPWSPPERDPEPERGPYILVPTPPSMGPFIFLPSPPTTGPESHNPSPQGPTVYTDDMPEEPEPTPDGNKLHHIFDDPDHNLDSLVDEFGSQSEAFNMLKIAAGAAVGGNADGTFEVVVSVGGMDVTVRGAVVDGQVRIGTAFIP